MVLRWSTSKIVFSDPDLAPKWLLNNFPIGSYVKTMPADGSHFGARSGSLNTILEVDHLRTIDDMFAINYVICHQIYGFCLPIWHLQIFPTNYMYIELKEG
jgi:hypothetical protein